MKKENVYLTTSEAATICDVTRFTIRNWVISGKLKSEITTGGHRRISQEVLVEFMKANAISTDHVLAEKVETEADDSGSVVVEENTGKTVKRAARQNVEVRNRISSAIQKKAPASKGLLYGGLYRTGKYVGLLKKIMSKRNKAVAA